MTIQRKSYGFGLIEVLVSAVILSVGLIGLASLQNNSIQAIQEGDNLVTASMIAQEMARRMMSNPYMTAQGRQGYLALDLSGAIATAGGVQNWAASTLSSSPNITNCYAADTSHSCYNPGATIGNTSDHINALTNMMTMDQVEMRLMADSMLQNGSINICFDSSTAYTAFTCDNTATRIASRNENVFTVKVQWTDVLTNTSQIYALQFTAQCTITTICTLRGKL